jgi:protein tyrosine phosphatase (PTP) superfamily phosphohydrolase (DUF442 family)
LNITFTNHWLHWGAGGYFRFSNKELFDALQSGKIKQDEFFRQYLVAIAAFVEQSGFCTREQMFFIGGDEPWAKDVRDRMRPGYVLAKEALPWLKRTSGAAHPGIEGLDDLIDIWCPQIREFNPDAYKADKREVWMYTCGWKHPLPCFSIPVPGMSPRMLYWLCRKFGVTGFLYWGTNVWAVGNDINKVQALPREKKPWVCDGWKPFYVGDGALTYPTPEGPIPSQRLLNIRDGVEDWLYLELLSQAIAAAEKAGQPVPAEARGLAAVPHAMVASIREWNKSPESLEAARKQVAQWIVKLTPKPKAATGAQKPQLAAPRNDLPGLPNFAKISDALYRGAQPTREGFLELKKMGVRTVVNLRTAHSDKELMTGLGLKYVSISFKPWHAEDEDVIPFLKVVANPQHQPVFVHCQHGADRTGTMVAIYRVCVQGWDMKQAMEELPRFGFHSIWENLRRYLLALDAVAMKAKAASAQEPKVEIVP